MKTQKQVIKYIKKNYGFWIKVIAVLVIAYGIKLYFFKKRNIPMYELYIERDLLKYNKTINIKIDKKNKLLIKDNKTAYYHKLNNSSIRRIYRGHKKKTNDILLKNNIPVCKNIQWDTNSSDSENIKIINKELKFPLVVKPISGESGYGVKTNINDNKALIKHINELKNYKKHMINIKKGILIEEQEIGEKYRIVVLNGKIIYVKLDKVPIITGDGKTQISSLIKNFHIVNKTIDSIKHIDKDLILQQGYQLNNILEKNKKIKITNVATGDASNNIKETNLSKIHPDNVRMFLETNNVLKYNLSGIDYVTKDLSIPYYNSGKIIEVNSDPGVSFINNNTFLTNRFIDALFIPRKYN